MCHDGTPFPPAYQPALDSPPAGLPKSEQDAIIAPKTPFKRPRHIMFGELPRTATGEVQKFILRQRAREAPDKLRRPGY
jgi:acyl-coenzyme A synthetase/AMP-(fatty) acid ligase